jgi:hypothetical protein
MDSDRRIFWVVLAVVLAGLGLLLFWPRIETTLGPRPVAAWVAVEAEGSGTAVVGPVELAAGRGFTLHAVLEAETRGGSAVYYTGAPALQIGDRPVPAEAVRPWDPALAERVKVLWFTVEGTVPWLRLEPGQDLSRFRMTEILRPDWPQSPTIPGRLDPANDDALVRGGARGDLPFGTQRYHVRIELYERPRDLVPEERFPSPDAAAARESPASFPGVTAALPGPLGPASRLFGLTQVEPVEGKDGDLLRQIQDLTDRRLAFSRVTALDAVLRSAGAELGELSWRRVDLSAGPPWGEAGAMAGDLVRVGERVVFLYQDHGLPGVLDRADLCFDLARGAQVRALHEVFAGGGDVELASLTGPRPGPP